MLLKQGVIFKKPRLTRYFCATDEIFLCLTDRENKKNASNQAIHRVCTKFSQAKCFYLIRQLLILKIFDGDS